MSITNRKALETISCDCYMMVKRNIDQIAAAARQQGQPDEISCWKME
jgi:hypothetical protein